MVKGTTSYRKRRSAEMLSEPFEFLKAISPITSPSLQKDLIRNEDLRSDLVAVGLHFGSTGIHQIGDIIKFAFTEPKVGQLRVRKRRATELPSVFAQEFNGCSTPFHGNPPCAAPWPLCREDRPASVYSSPWATDSECARSVLFLCFFRVSRGFRRVKERPGNIGIATFPGLRPFVELRGFEPLTPSMPWRCATSCAIAPRNN